MGGERGLSVGISLGRDFIRGPGRSQGRRSSEAGSDKARQRQTFSCQVFYEEPLASLRALRI